MLTGKLLTTLPSPCSRIRLIENAGLKAYEELFDEIIKVAHERGVKFGQLQIVDSVHLVADVNVEKDK